METKHGPADAVKRHLEDAFFLNEDQRIIDNLRKMRAMKETKTALSSVSGITNDAILTRLVELEIRPETLASLAVVPLVEVAWADGSVDEKEKTAILKAAREQGMAEEGIEYNLLHEWMEHRPTADLLDAWIHYIRGLCESLAPEDRGGLRTALLGKLNAIADASGGLLGLGIGSRISKAEAAVIAKLEMAFEMK